MKIKIADELPENVTAFLGPLEAGKVYDVPATDGHVLLGEGLAEHAEVGAEPEQHEELTPVTMKSRTLDGFDAYDEGETYWVPTTLARHFTGNGWATLAVDAKKPRGRGAQPRDMRELTEEEGEEINRAFHEPAITRQRVVTIRQIGTGPNEVVGTGEQDVYEGDDVQVVDLSQGQSVSPDGGTTLDVQDVRTDSGTQI